MKNAKRSGLAANAAADAQTALLDGGWLDIYAGAQPAACGDAPAGALLASLRFGTPAFAAAVEGVAAANPITSEPDAPASGTAAWYRCTRADHSTAVQDGSAGTADANLVMASTSIAAHDVVPLDSFSFTERKS